VYQAIHIFIGLLLAGAAVIMYLYGKGYFQTLYTRSGAT
jgi:hypothetical protein